MGHRVETARAAEKTAARPIVHTAVGPGLRRRAIAPIVGAAAEKRPLPRIGNVGICRLGARLDETDGDGGILGEPGGEHAAGGAGADDKDVEATHRRSPRDLGRRRCGRSGVRSEAIEDLALDRPQMRPHGPLGARRITSGDGLADGGVLGVASANAVRASRIGVAVAEP
jgi:hypothetical protein